jgi:hypothetical protein
MEMSLMAVPAARHREDLSGTGASTAPSASERKSLAPPLRDLVAEAIRAASGKARAAAIDIGIHEAHLSRLLKDGTLRVEQLEVLGPVFAVKFAQQLLEHYGPLCDPKDHARRSLREIEDAITDLKQFVEHL